MRSVLRRLFFRHACSCILTVFVGRAGYGRVVRCQLGGSSW